MAIVNKDSVKELLYKIDGLNSIDSLAFFAAEYPGEVTFSSSFSFEDQYITHIILSNQLPISIFTLDTGRLFTETYSVWSSTNERYHTHIKAYFPQPEPLQAFVAANGPNAFYESVYNRKTCCHIRKVEPLKRALQGNKIWVTGLRAEHSTNRQQVDQLEWDEGNQVLKFHPLLHSSTADIKAKIAELNIPYNPLHDRGFISIGCQPCTRAVRAGEDFRAGRWWWEDASKKECGLHETTHSVK